MTKLQKRVYIVMLRALFMILHWLIFHEAGAEPSDAPNLRADITNIIIELDKGT